jgi:hypothetical protein
MIETMAEIETADGRMDAFVVHPEGAGHSLRSSS